MSPDSNNNAGNKKSEQKKEILTERKYANFSIGRDDLKNRNVGDGGPAPSSQPPKPSEPPPSSKKKSTD